MILFKSRLIFGLIKSIIVGAFKLVYKVLSAFNLQVTLLVILTGLIVFLCGGFESGGAVLTIFVIALFLSILYAVFGTVRRLLGLNKKKDRKRSAQIVEVKQETYEPQKEVQAPPTSYVDNQTHQPVYFRVKQNPEYIMAEYPDRYELYKTSGGKLIKIRTDYKGYINGDR